MLVKLIMPREIIFCIRAFFSAKPRIPLGNSYKFYDIINIILSLTNSVDYQVAIKMRIRICWKFGNPNEIRLKYLR